MFCRTEQVGMMGEKQELERNLWAGKAAEEREKEGERVK
jgi:hypothetical protein